MIYKPRHKIIITKIGDFDTGIFKPISDAVSRVFGYPTEIMPLLQNADFALEPKRNQYHSTKILEKLAGRAPSNAIKILAITEVDLFIPILTHVYGEAQLAGKACIISTFRLREALPPINAQEVYLQRVIKEAIHELGHTFNLRHCPDHNCIMHYCRSEKDVDIKSDEFCRYCKIMERERSP